MIMPPKGSTQRGCPPLGDSLVTFSSGRKSPGCRAERLHIGECRGAPAPRIGPQGPRRERPARPFSSFFALSEPPSPAIMGIQIMIFVKPITERKYHPCHRQRKQKNR